MNKKPSAGSFGSATSTGGLFGSKVEEKKFKPASGGKFGDKELPKIEPETTAKPLFGSLTGSTAPATQLFGSAANNQPTKPLFGGAPSGGGLFGGAPSGSGLFGNAPAQQKDKDGKEVAKPSGGLFNFGGSPATTTGGGLFGSAPGTSLGAAVPGKSVFASTGNLFKKPDKPATTTEGDDDE